MPASDHSAFSSRLPFARLALALAVAALALGCTPKIGDSCTVSTNCSAAGDRLCDITQPGGYCTIFNCEPGSCPEDSACINFGTTLSSVAECGQSQGNSPYQRSFCMARCSSNGDCRGDYVCLDLSGKPNADGTPSNPLGAILAETSGSGTVCAVKPHDAPALNSYGGGASNEVCTGSDSDGGVTHAAGSGSGGSGGAAAEAGAAGESGAGG